MNRQQKAFIRWQRKWFIAGMVYFSLLFSLVPAMALAYIDPSVTSYAIQAIAGVIVASGAFFAAYGRRAKKRISAAFGLDEVDRRKKEAPVEVYDADLKAELDARRAAAAEKPETKKEKRHWLRRIILSLVCGLALAMTLVLRPIISFYISNEGEFWFSLGSVIGLVLLVFAAVAAVVFLIHFLLPDKRKISLRLVFAALVAGTTLCLFVQNHFMSSHLPMLTGDPIDWSLYGTQNILSIALWAGVLILSLILVLVRPRFMRVGAYFLLIFLFCAEAVAGTVDLAAAKHENKKIEAHFTEVGIWETSKAGNVVVLISDTFEGTYMNRILEDYPEYRDLLSDCTYYDNVTGTSVFTYFSYAKLLSGVDFPNGSTSEEGITYCFNHQTTVDRIRRNNWDIGYYTTFSPTPDMQDKILNYSDNILRPDRKTAWALTKLLIKSTLFQSMPQPLKPYFLAYTFQYEQLKALLPVGKPFVEDDTHYYVNVNEDGLVPVDGKPRYSIVQLYGVHSPSYMNADFLPEKYSEDVPYEYRKEQAARAQLKLLRTYLDRLKEAGTYDQTTVIMTADHGFNLRYYPVFIVKEANRTDEGFKIDHTPLSMQEDYENLIAALTAGRSFSDAVAEFAQDENRVRYALDYRSVGGYGTKTYRRSIVQVTGPASMEESYHIEKDEFYMDNEFSGRCVLNTPFIVNSAYNNTVSVYGIAEGDVHGHTVLFDAFFDTEEKRSLILKATIKNITDVPQRVVFKLDDQIIAVENIPESGEPVNISVTLPEKEASRYTLEITTPDALLRYITGEGLEWNAYDSIVITEAGFYDH